MRKQIKNRKRNSKKKKMMMRTIISVSIFLLIGEVIVFYHLQSNSKTNKKQVDIPLQTVTKYEITTSTPAPYDTPHIISNTSEDEEIRKLKRRMIQLGWMKQNAEITGDFDVNLQNAIRDMKEYYYNNWNNIALGEAAVDMPEMNIDIVDEKTWSLIFDNWIPSPTIVPTSTLEPVPTQNVKSLGIWSFNYFVDDFGDKTNQPYISSGWINGTFSNTATTDSPLKVMMRIYYSMSMGMLNIDLQLDEYANGHIADMSLYKGCSLNIKDGSGEKTKMTGDCYKKSLYFSYTCAHDLKDILIKGGKIQFVLTCSKSTYNFTINNADGFENAFEKLFQETPFIRETPTPRPAN